MSSFSEDTRRLLGEARTLPHGPPKVRLLEEAVRLADLHGDEELGYRVRMDLISAATYGGMPDRALVAFSWCRSSAKKRGGGELDWDLLWRQKWIVDKLVDSPTVSREKLEAALEDLAQTYAAYGGGERVIAKIRCVQARSMGETDRARDLMKKWLATPSDSLSDCPACDRNGEVETWVEVGQLEKAIEMAEPLFAGRMKCAEIPHHTHARMLLPLAQTGRFEEAARSHRTGHRLISQNVDFLGSVGQHLEYLAAVGNLGRAVELFEKHVGWTEQSTDVAAARDFWTGAFAVFARVAEDRPTVQLRLPAGFAGYKPDGLYDTRELLAGVERAALELALAFDRRNGNDFYARRLAAAKSRRLDVTLRAKAPSRKRVAEPKAKAATVKVAAKAPTSRKRKTSTKG